MRILGARLVRRPLALYERYERHIGTTALLVGFLVDTLTLTRIDLWLDNLILVSYLFLAIVGVVLINLYEGEILRGSIFYYIRTFAPLPIQFAFGGLFSGFTVFYSRSAAFSSSWLFLTILLAALVGNEFFRARYARLNFQMSILFIAIFLYAVFAVPILVGRMGAWIFLLSGGVSIAFIFLLVYIFYFFMPRRMYESRKILFLSIGGIYVAMNILYFLNIIPPIPLSLKDAGVYHGVVRGEDGLYYLEGEPRSFFDRFRSGELHVAEGMPAYFFSAVFAPTDLDVTVIHNWERYNEGDGEWRSSAKIPFFIVGGRDGGYRGYSRKSYIPAGLWRVSVETERGQVLGRVKFKVIKVDGEVLLETVTR